MSKDSVGVWSVTFGFVKSDMYPYNMVSESTGL
jgi:hypothetical protein